MKKLIESLKRLYQKGKVTEQKIRQMEEDGTINPVEAEYILEE